MRRLLVPLAALALALTACATATPGGAGSPSEPASPPASPDQVYVARATMIQSEGADPALCLGIVLESYPPQCDGPTLVGLDWADVPDAETASGVTWGSGWVVGTYDAERNIFTLTEPVQADPPPGVESPSITDPALAALCEDPWRDGDESALNYEDVPEDWPEAEFTDRFLSAESMELVTQLQERAAALPGYVEIYVSNGMDEFNVLFTDGTDLAAAHTALREVWPGWLCVGAAPADAPTNEDAMRASDALSAAFGEPWDLGVLGWSPDTTAGTFQVDVILATPELREQIEDALAPWYSPTQVVINSALRPLPS